MAFIYLDNDTLMSGEAYIERHDHFNAISLITLEFFDALACLHS